ncbi:MAG: Gfo/Idh/MocA family oxidoreductase [Planctomycetia bacterium]|nr:Gfo/Idh/MocA family oxidoreductase [Planctomycetia bacterium]
MASRVSRRRVSRRSFLGGSLGTAALASLPTGGVFAAGSDVIRVGVVGCGGRGTGAALQAVAAEPGVVVTALGDLFTDHLAVSAEILASRLGDRFACPDDSRFTGAAAGFDVIASDIDMVILATPPHLRPAHVAAAIQAGRHVYCETPAAVDAAGTRSILALADEARRRGLSFAAGLHSRHDMRLERTIARVLDGSIGRPVRGVATARLGLPWRRGPLSGRTATDTAARNWITDQAASGGSFVEHHIHALDRLLWAFGDVAPIAALPIDAPLVLPSHVTGGPPAATTVRFVFAGGGSLDAGIERREGTTTEAVETVTGTRGEADLRTHAVSGRSPRPLAEGSLGSHAACMASMVRSLTSGRRVDDLATLCRSTMVALLGREAAEAARPVAWSELWPAGPESLSLRPLQSDMG